ncbi:hypothetical protein BCR33DRAFT_792525 [Rhizoclosmatium globosum]|uniref:Uncharacterized protein n=1 Tax=Rhizoclosmatium globosum TaxID=329046 RepID=A0A1Y2B881_9FUNG|nr:hypothetical protein BCR33DRAFT_792525 [Rhizoclosmatium globosum]|eukprot:ORY30707.1 hypothetical protein BCR33DRAFT_792525 [Rhizoclosmatium globosum]
MNSFNCGRGRSDKELFGVPVRSTRSQSRSLWPPNTDAIALNEPAFQDAQPPSSALQSKRKRTSTEIENLKTNKVALGINKRHKETLEELCEMSSNVSNELDMILNALVKDTDQLLKDQAAEYDAQLEAFKKT